MKQLLKILLGKNSYYIISAIVVLLWTFFFDSHSVISQYYLRRELATYEKDKAYYEDELARVTKEKEAVMGTDDALEKFAREKYLMKKEGETVFVIVDKDGNYLETN